MLNKVMRNPLQPRFVHDQVPAARYLIHCRLQSQKHYKDGAHGLQSTTNSGYDGMVSKKYATDGIATDVCVRTQNVLKLLIILECSIILEVDSFGFGSRLLNRPLNV